MIAQAPRGARPIGIVLLVAGPPGEPVRWSGWAEVWTHADGKDRAAFPRMASIRHARGADRRIHIRIVEPTFKACA